MGHTNAPQQLPKLIMADRIIPTMNTIVDRIRSVHNLVAQTVNPLDASFENVIRPLIEVENRTQGETGVIAMLRYAAPDQASRDASDAACKLWEENYAEFYSRKDWYLLLKAVKDREELDLESAKYLDTILQDFERSGHGRLDETQIKEYFTTRNEIDDLRRQFNRNIRNESSKLWFSLAELDGVPSVDLRRFEKRCEPGNSVEEATHYCVELSRDATVVLNHAKIPLTRKTVWVADANKLPENVPLFHKIVLLRDQNARRLGYASHAAFRLEKRMAKSPEWVDRLLDDLENTLEPIGREEMKALTELKRQEQQQAVLHPWDYAYYARLAEEKVRVDHSLVAEYFPLQHTISKMLDLFAHCLQLRFEPVPAEILNGSRWHEDVEAWSLWDERTDTKGQFIGYLYMDLFSRPNKYKGSQNVNLQCGYRKKDGSRVYPATILMCAFPRNSNSGNLVLLKHKQVISLFHELGHGIHDLVSKTAYVKFHGHRAPPDFAEAPSVMLENWCWMKEELKSMCCHYTALDTASLEAWRAEHPDRADQTPPEKISEELLNGLLECRNVNRALWYMRQIAYARFDMAVHHIASHEKCKALDPTTLFNDIMGRLSVLSHPSREEVGHRHADVGHYMAGYDAGYYSYLSAHVVAAELFEQTFAVKPRCTNAWERYRRGVLEYGGSRDELHMLQDFLGHVPSPRVLLASF